MVSRWPLTCVPESISPSTLWPNVMLEKNSLTVTKIIITLRLRGQYPKRIGDERL